MVRISRRVGATDGGGTPSKRAGHRGPERDYMSTALWPGSMGAAIGERIRARNGRDTGGAAAVEEVASSYLDFRLRDEPDEAGPLDAWCASLRDCSGATELFRELHLANPQAAERVARGLVALPEPGEDFLGFRLVGELGRGAFGRVYLARQGDLADRCVALKISADVAGEAQNLAQLQHTNIVPIFSMHRAGDLHAVCMPYLGSATLADVSDELVRSGELPDSGQALVNTLGSRRSRSALPPTVAGRSTADPSTPPRPTDAPEASVPGSEPADGPGGTLRMLGGLPYVQAVLWIGARLAEGLAHAHARGILHRDLKPANVLLTDDGQPMLLDFNLSEDIKRPVALSAASVGGTLPYMAPEHLEAFLRRGGTVDARADIYGLGVILYELLAGRHPFPAADGHRPSDIDRMIEDRRAGSPRLRDVNPRVSPAAESIVRHCLEPDPARRYPSALALREDLERHMADLPLRHATEPSVRERARKWSRRHPRVASSSTILIACAAIMAGTLAILHVRARRVASLAATGVLARFRDDLADVRYLLGVQTPDEAKRARGLGLALRALARYAVMDDPAWEERPAVADLGPAERGRLREDVGEVFLLLAQAVALDAAEQADAARRARAAHAALGLSAKARACFGNDRAPQALWVQQAQLMDLLGRGDEARVLRAEAEAAAPRTARDYYLAASGHAAAGAFEKALPLAEAATRLDPSSYWAWFVAGVCHDNLGRFADAMACFTTCIALRPDDARAWFNRGVSYFRRADLDRAGTDFDRAITLDPAWHEPYLNRALVRRDLGDHQGTITDLTRALKLGASETRIYFLRATARELVGDAPGAGADREEGLRREPADELSWIARGLARLPDDPAGALADFERAQAVNPHSLQALQLRGHVLSDMPGRAEEAIRALDRAVELYPDYAPARSGRGVLHARAGHRAQALDDAREALLRDTSPQIVYQVAGIYALASKQTPDDRLEALRLLATALRAGFGLDLIDEDHELDPIRDTPEFRHLVVEARRRDGPKLPRPPGR